MKKKLSIALIVASFITTLFSCKKAERQITVEKAAGTNKLKLFDKVYVNLPEEHESGYMWMMQNDLDKSIVDYKGSNWHGASNPNVDFHFEAIYPGKTQITLFKAKHFDTTAIKTFVFEVEE